MMKPLAWMALEVGTCYLTGTSMPWGTTYPPTCWATANSGHCLFILALGQWESMNDHKTTPTTDDGNRWIMALIYSRNANTSSEVCHVMNQTTPAFIMHRFVVKYSMRMTNISDTWYGLLCLFFFNLALLVIFVKKQTVRSCGKNKKKTSSSSIQTNDFDWLLSSFFESRRGASVASWWE